MYVYICICVCVCDVCVWFVYVCICMYVCWYAYVTDLCGGSGGCVFIHQRHPIDTHEQVPGKDLRTPGRVLDHVAIDEAYSATALTLALALALVFVW